MAIRCFTVFLAAVLMMEFCKPEFTRRSEFGFHIETPFLRIDMSLDGVFYCSSLR